MLARSEQTASEIASSVRKANAHIVLDVELRRLNDERQSVRDKQREAYAADAHNKEPGVIAALSNDLADIDQRLADCRAKLAPLRELHAAKIAEALEPFRRDRAARLLALLGEAREHMVALHESAREIERAGGSARRMPLPWLDQTERLASAIAGTANLGR